MISMPEFMSKKICAAAAALGVALVFAAIALFGAPGAQVAAGPASGELSGRVIILDPGHGAGDSPGYAGYVEHVAMLRLARLIRPLLEARGATVLMTRDGDGDVSLAARAALTNLWSLEFLYNARQDYPAELAEIRRLADLMRLIANNPWLHGPVFFNMPFDQTFQRVIHDDLAAVFALQAQPVVQDAFLFISLHSNSMPLPANHAINGASAYFISNTSHQNQRYFAQYANVDRSRRFAEYILQGIHPLGIRNRGASSSNWFVIREHNLPGVLVENGFHTNPSDRALLSNDEFLHRLAETYVEAIVRYFAYVGPLQGVAQSGASSIAVPYTHPVHDDYDEWMQRLEDLAGTNLDR